MTLAEQIEAAEAEWRAVNKTLDEIHARLMALRMFLAPVQIGDVVERLGKRYAVTKVTTVTGAHFDVWGCQVRKNAPRRKERYLGSMDALQEPRP